MLDGLHDFNWREELQRALQEIWQAVEARDGQRELSGRQQERELERMQVRKQETNKKRTLAIEQPKHQKTQQHRAQSNKRKRR
jgi:hypothetical protein